MPYTAFVAPGLLASSAMNGAMIDSTFLVFFKLKIAKTYDAMLATPLGVGDVALGELSWCVLRGALYSGAFLAIMAILGYVVSPWAVLCWPAAVLISLAFASAGMAGTTYMRTWQDFDMVSLAFIPLFLFSATFYPLTVYPGWLQAVVRCTPLYQGVVLVRAADLGIFDWVLLAHIAYLVAMAVAGVAHHPAPARARSSCRDRAARAADTVGPISRASGGTGRNEHRGEQRQGWRRQDDHRRLPGRRGRGARPRPGHPGRRRPPGLHGGVVRRRSHSRASTWSRDPRSAP